MPKFHLQLPLLLLRHLFVASITFSFFFFFFVSSSSDLAVPRESEGGRGVAQRGLKSFKEKATGTNITFDCSPSGPCVPCLYSEKKDETYRCSETGYRIPMRCAKAGTPADDENENKKQKGRTTLENTKEEHVLVHDVTTTSERQRNLLEDSSTNNIEVGSEVYVTYRSCIPAVNQEKFSVLGFEALMLLLLVSSSYVIFRRKGSLVLPGALRLPTNARF